MIAIQNDLTQKRAELKQSITARIEQTFPAYLFHLVGGVIKQVFNLKQPPHWSINATVLCILMYVPGLVLAVASGEIRSWDIRYWTLLGAYIYAYFAPIVSHINVSYNLLPGIRDGLVDFIQTTEDLEKLQDWLDRFFSFRGWLLSMILGGVAFGLMMSIYVSWVTNGLIGMGMSFLISYFFSLIQVYIIAHIKYKFSFISGFYKIFAFQFLLAFGCFVAVKIIGSPYSYAVGLFFTFASLYFSYKELDKRLDVKSILIAMKNKF